jgi:hypothetical protein
LKFHSLPYSNHHNGGISSKKKRNKHTRDSDKKGAWTLGFNSLVILGAWTLWKQFDGMAPNFAAAPAQAEEETKVWELAGAKGISSLDAQLPGV